MRINNPFPMNDWEIEKFLKTVFVIQIVLLAIVYLDTIGINIVVIRQLIGFAYLTFIPGIVLLRILRVHNLSLIETLLYTVGLSIAFLMFMGYLLNTLYPFILLDPISTTPLLITITLATSLLCILSYIRDKDFSASFFISHEDMSSTTILFLSSIPVLSVLGAYFMLLYNNNVLILFLLLVLSLLPIVTIFDFIPIKLYALVIFVTSISLFFINSLISTHLWGWDIHIEYYFSNLVYKNSYWNIMLPNNLNGMLSLVMLAPTYSYICDLNLIWVFKIMYPLLFSLVPLGLYKIVQKQTNNKMAFLSTFFFISIFYTSSCLEMMQLARQQIAEIFLVSLILIMVNKKTKTGNLSPLLSIIFCFSLVVSHYAISYLYILYLISVWLTLGLTKKLPSSKKRTITSSYVLLFITFTLIWSIYTSSGTSLQAIMDIGYIIANSIFKEFLNPEAVQGLGLLLSVSSPIRIVHKIFHVICQFLIVIGLFITITKQKKTTFDTEYTAFSFTSLAILLAGITVPYFASSIETSRLYSLTLFFLAPFCILGGIEVFSILRRMLGLRKTNEIKQW